jgi:shikimate dehydrogenase
VEQLSIFDVDASRARDLADNLNQHFGSGRAQAGHDLGNAWPRPTAWSTPRRWAWPNCRACRCRLPCCAQLWVAEIVYFPLETELLRNARALGCRTLDGGNMAVFQAVKAFELFSGVVPDAQRMLAHFQSMNTH